MRQTLRGGRADKMSPKDFKKRDLEKGLRHEREHTSDDRMAREIAMDHLAEDPDYYKKLEQLEKKGFSLGLAKIMALIS